MTTARQQTTLATDQKMYFFFLQKVLQLVKNLSAHLVLKTGLVERRQFMTHKQNISDRDYLRTTWCPPPPFERCETLSDSGCDASSTLHFQILLISFRAFNMFVYRLMRLFGSKYLVHSVFSLAALNIVWNK